MTDHDLSISGAISRTLLNPLFIALAALFCLGIALPAQAADWVCGAINASGSTGWSVAPSKAQAQAKALAQCGSGCFITGCEYGVGQTVEEAEKTKPQESEKPKRVFNNIPERRIVPPARPAPAPVARPQPARPSPAATASAPKKTSEPENAAARQNTKPRTTTTIIRSKDCNQPIQRAPTAKKIEVNPCADNAEAMRNLHVPQDRIDHQGPRAERYIRSLANCRQRVNGVCIDPNQKMPKSEAGGPIYMPQ